jgi:perosamine synthetase
VVLEEGIPRDIVMKMLLEVGIETRPFFYPLHTLPMYLELVKEKSFPISERLARQGMNLPSSALLSEEDVTFVTGQLKQVLASFPGK